MEYIGTNNSRNKPFVSTLPLIPSSCINIIVFGYRQVFDEIVFFLKDAFLVGK